MNSGKFLLFAAILLSACSLPPGKTPSPDAFQISENLFDITRPGTLGLSKPVAIQHHLVFKAQAQQAQYNHGAVLFPFKGKLFIQWQSSQRDEDAPETKILFSQSTNGHDWSKAQLLAPARADALITNGGWWSDGETLVAYINVWPNNIQPKAGYVEYITSSDGNNWSAPQRLTNNKDEPIDGIIEQDLKQLSSGRILTAIHHPPGLIAKPFYTDDPTGISGWTQGAMTNLPHQPGISRELEPSWFLNAEKNPVMVFRDQGSSFKVLASHSNDNGYNWSTPIATNMPDSRAKQSAGNLPNGCAYLINNPSGSKTRTPLTITLSQDGALFDRAYLLRSESELPPMRYEGKYKRIGYSYPKSIVWNNRVWASYAVNKEDIEVTEIEVKPNNPACDL